MSYRTWIDIKIIEQGPMTDEQVLDAFNDIANNINLQEQCDDSEKRHISGGDNNGCDYRELIKMSKRYPHLLFEGEIDGTKEESDDQSVFRIRNGKSERIFAQLFYAPFDELLTNKEKALLKKKSQKSRIVFKNGREGEMTLDAIKGIAIPRIDGATILVYPKYKKCELLAYERRYDWKEPDYTELEALLEDTDKSKERTDALLELDSPAAKFVRGIGKQYNIPSLLTAGTIKKYCREINTLAKQIEGADVLPESSSLWSCLRSGAINAWSENGNGGFSYYCGLLYRAYVVVPVAHLKNPSESDA